MLVIALGFVFIGQVSFLAALVQARALAGRDGPRPGPLLGVVFGLGLGALLGPNPAAV